MYKSCTTLVLYGFNYHRSNIILSSIYFYYNELCITCIRSISYVLASTAYFMILHALALAFYVKHDIILYCCNHYRISCTHALISPNKTFRSKSPCIIYDRKHNPFDEIHPYNNIRFMLNICARSRSNRNRGYM